MPVISSQEVEILHLSVKFGRSPIVQNADSTFPPAHHFLNAPIYTKGFISKARPPPLQEHPIQGGGWGLSLVQVLYLLLFKPPLLLSSPSVGSTQSKDLLYSGDQTTG